MAIKNPRVSIGMPVYNGVEYLSQSLDSLLSQTYGEFELIISDNASSDETEEICRSYAAQDKRIRYCRQEENLGSVQNFNRVFELSRGEYFKWAAYDDVCHPTFLARCVKVLDSDPAIVWCHPRSSHIDHDGWFLDDPNLRDVSYVAQEPGSKRSTATRASASPAKRFAAVLLGQGGCIDAYGLMRSDVIRQTPLYQPYFGSEKVFIAELALRGRFYEIPETLFLVRIHPRAAGNMRSADEQKRYINPLSIRRFELTRLRLLAGYVDAIRRADLSLSDRTRCLGVVLQYLLQVKKWKRVLAKTLTGAGLAEDASSRCEDASLPSQDLEVPASRCEEISS